MLDVVADRTRAAVHSWLDARSREWPAHIRTVALDPWRGYASTLVAPLGHAIVVVDHFYAIKLANAVADQVRRRTQQAALGHRGRKRDPLYRIRKLLLTAAEQLTSRGRVRLWAGLAAGHPGGEVAAAWQGKELLRAVYAADDLVDARAALGHFCRWADGVGVPELSRLARTGRAWEAEVLAFHTTDGCSNGPTKAMNLLIKKTSGSGTASATSPTTGCGCCCTAASGGRLTRPRNCEAAPHAWWRRAPRAGHPPLGSQVRLTAPRAEPDRPGGPLAVDLGRLLLGRGDLVLEPRTGGVGSIRGRAQRPDGGSRTVASRTHGLKPPRMFRLVDAPKLVVGPSQRDGGGRRVSARTEGTPCVAAGRTRALARQQQPRRSPWAAVVLARSNPPATRQ